MGRYQIVYLKVDSEIIDLSKVNIVYLIMFPHLGAMNVLPQTEMPSRLYRPSTGTAVSTQQQLSVGWIS